MFNVHVNLHYNINNIHNTLYRGKTTKHVFIYQIIDCVLPFSCSFIVLQNNLMFLINIIK